MVKETPIHLQPQNVSLASEMEQRHPSQWLSTLHMGVWVSVHAPTDVYVSYANWSSFTGKVEEQPCFAHLSGTFPGDEREEEKFL